jgi:hypothetical protein
MPTSCAALERVPTYRCAPVAVALSARCDDRARPIPRRHRPNPAVEAAGLQACNDPAILKSMRLDRDRWRRAAGSLAAAAAGLSASPRVARATEELPLPIVAWSAPLECPNAEGVVQRLMSLTGANAARLAHAGAVRGEIHQAEREWVLSLEIAASAPAGGAPFTAPARVFRAEQCDDLAEAAAVAIALALGGAPEPEAAAPPASPPPAETPAAGVPPVAATSEDERADDDADDPHQRGSTPLGFVAGAEAVFDSASLGGAAVGLGAEAQLRLAELGIAAYAIGLPSYQIPVATAQYVELSLWAAGLRGCYRASDAVIKLDLYAGAELGALGAAGHGLLDASMRRDAWGAATWGAHVGIDLLEHLRLGARFEAVLPLSRPRYLVNATEVVHEVPSASVRLGVSLASTFGAH